MDNNNQSNEAYYKRFAQDQGVVTMEMHFELRQLLHMTDPFSKYETWKF